MRHYYSAEILRGYIFLCTGWEKLASHMVWTPYFFFTLLSLIGISSLPKSDYLPASLTPPNLSCSNTKYLCGLGRVTWARKILRVFRLVIRLLEWEADLHKVTREIADQKELTFFVLETNHHPLPCPASLGFHQGIQRLLPNST